MKEEFIPRRFNKATRENLERIQTLLAEYEGTPVSNRQLYYQFVSRRWLTYYKKTKKAKAGLQKTKQSTINNICRNARNAGLIDWEAIEDRSRTRHDYVFDDDPTDAINTAAYNYQEDPWIGQKYHVGLMIEKDALLGVVSGVCGEFFVPHMGTHGNNSDSFMYETGKRLAAKADQGLISIVLYLGDLDPSGDDMSRDVQERLSRYARREIEVRRLALNPDQVRRYNLPPFEASDDDTRTDGYQRKYGSKDSWELDALPPPVLIGMIRTELNGLIDHKRWKRAKAQARRNSELMHDVGNNWAKVEKMFKRR